MKKLIFLSLISLCAFTVSAQQTYFPTSIPPSSISFTPTYRFIGTDSLAKFYLSNSSRWSQFYTAAQANALFLRSITTGNGLSGNGSSGSPVILGGTLTAPTIINYSLPDSLKFFDPSTSSGLFFKGGASGGINIIENNGSFHTALGASAGSYSFQVTNGSSNSGLTGSTSNGLGIIDQIKNLGMAFAANYTTNQRLQRLSVPSVETTIALIDSVKGTISGGTTTHPLTLSYGLTGTSFDGSTAVTTKVDSSLLQTVLNFFPKGDTRYLKSSSAASTYALQTTTISAGIGLTGGGSLATNRTINVDSTQFRTVANSYSLSGLQTKFNGYTPVSRTVAGFPLSSNVTLASLSLGYGLTGGSYNPSTAGTANADTATLQTIANFFPKGDTRYLSKANNLSDLSNADTAKVKLGVYNTITTLTPTISGQAARIAYVNNTANVSDLVIYFHGSGETQNEAFTNINEKRVTDYLLQQGYIVASSNAHGNGWGNQACQDDYVNLYTYITGLFNINKVIFIGQSMGALASLNLIASGRIPVDSWYGIYPCTNLSYAYFSEGFAAPIETAYGFSGGSNYAAATAGYDPNLTNVSSFAKLKYRFTASPSDAVIIKSQNTDLFAARLPDSLVIQKNIVITVGNHGDPSNFLPLDAYSFMRQPYNIPYFFVGKNIAQFFGPVWANGVKSDTPDPSQSYNDITGGMNYWGFRTGTLNDFNIDVYNRTSPTTATPLNVIKITQQGVIQFPQLANGIVTTNSSNGKLQTIADNSTNWTTAYNNRISSLVTSRSSGTPTFTSNVLDIPTYTLTGLGGLPLVAGPSNSLTGILYVTLPTGGNTIISKAGTGGLWYMGQNAGVASGDDTWGWYSGTWSPGNGNKPILQFNSTNGSAVFGSTVQLNNYTVSTLPAGTVGMVAYVTDATAPTYNGALTGGGAVTVPVFYNGSAWVSH